MRTVAVVRNAVLRVDSPTDPLIQKIMAIQALKELEKRQLLSPQQLSVGVTYLLDLAGGLFDGMEATDLPRIPPQEKNIGGAAS